MGKKSSRGKKTAKREVKTELKQKPSEDPVLKEIIVGVVGEHGYEVAKEFMKKEITAEEAGKKLGVHVNIVRKVLYNLYENRVASYRRVVDRQSGWYVYYWRVDPGRAREYFENNRRLLLRKLEQRLETERNTNFFSCGNEDPTLPFELAAENDFKCPRCGDKLKPYDNSGVVLALERKIESLRQDLISIDKPQKFGTGSGNQV